MQRRRRVKARALKIVESYHGTIIHRVGGGFALYRPRKNKIEGGKWFRTLERARGWIDRRFQEDHPLNTDIGWYDAGSAHPDKVHQVDWVSVFDLYSV